MKTRLATRSALLGTLSAAALGCGDEESFLPLSQLCPAVAEELCSARNGGCCAPVDQVSCEMAETARCESAQGAFTSEGSRSYDARAASRQLQAVRASLDACGAAPSLSSFFGAGLPIGMPCERATQCASGSCSGSPLVCVEVVDAPLCAP